MKRRHPPSRLVQEWEWNGLLLIILLAVLACPTSLGAQTFSEAHRVRMIDTGSEVRIGVTLVERRHPVAIVDRRIQSLIDRRVRGIVRRITPDSLYLGVAGSDSVVAFPRARIQGTDLNLGRSRRASARELALNLALLGGMIMSTKFVGEEPDRRYRTDWEGGAVGAAVGFGGGALLGFLFPYERWRTGWIPE